MNNNKFQDILNSQISRRTILGAAALVPFLNQNVFAQSAGVRSFDSLAENMDDTVTVPIGYEWHKLISWGDPIVEGILPAINKNGAPFEFTRAQQEMRFGICNDMMAMFPKKYQYPWPETSNEWIFCSNNEYVVPYLMLETEEGKLNVSPAQIEALYAAQGASVYEVKYDGKHWSVVKNPSLNSGLNRRITPFTEVVFDGPAKNHPWILDGAKVTNAGEAKNGNRPKTKNGVLCGTMQNCAGGFTPWGTYLTAEENIDNMFFTSDTESDALMNARALDGFDFDETSFGYANRWKLGGPEQFDLSKSPHGPALYGWIVEIDPYNPNWTIKKRTALGRKKAECATTVIAKSEQIVVYSGDDQVNEFVYKFVSTGKFNSKNRAANMDLLSSGKLYAARFEADGTGRWIEISLKAANAVPISKFETPFKNYGDLMMRAREAARRLGATQMDRPEDVESPVDGTFIGKGAVYISCTGNQSDDGINGNCVNPRRKNGQNVEERNYTGQIIRIEEQNLDHCAINFSWEIYVMGGDHSAESVNIERTGDGEIHNMSSWLDGKQITKGARFAMPDNLTFTSDNRLFFTTDGTAENFACNDGIYAVEMDSPAPREVKRFLTGPLGAEITGPLFSPDNKTFFCGLQHVGGEYKDGHSYRGQTPMPPSNFPNGGWPRDTIIYVTRKDGGKI